MDIDFGSPRTESFVAKAPVAEAVLPPPAAEVVAEIPGLCSREQREQLRRRVRLIVAGGCALLLLLAYFVLLNFGVGT